MRAFLVLARGPDLARAATGHALPNLEDLDPELPYVPPVGPPIPIVPIDGEAILAKLDEGHVGGSFEF